jgi:hypothetical protein
MADLHNPPTSNKYAAYAALYSITKTHKMNNKNAKSILIVGGGKCVLPETWESTHGIVPSIFSNAHTIDINADVYPDFVCDFNNFRPIKKYNMIYFHNSTFCHVAKDDKKFFAALDDILETNGKIIFTYEYGCTFDMMKEYKVITVKNSLSGYFAKYPYGNYQEMKKLTCDNHKKFVMDSFKSNNYDIVYCESDKYPLYDDTTNSKSHYKFFVAVKLSITKTSSTYTSYRMKDQ